VTEISFDAGAVGDTVAHAKTALNDALGGERGDVNADDPRVAEALDKLSGATQEEKDKAEGTLDKGAGAARTMEVSDAEGSGAAGAVPVGGAAGTSGAGVAGGAGARVQPSVQVTPAALAQMSGLQPMSQPMPSQMMNPVSSPVSNLMNAANMVAPLAQAATQAKAPTSMAGKVALSPEQQVKLAEALADRGGDVSSSEEISLNAGGGSVAEIAKSVVAADLPYAWGGGTLEGPSQGISDGGGAADANGDYNKVGFDCSGLSRYVHYQDTGVEVPRTSQAQYAAGTEVSLAEAKPGDFVFPNSSFSGGGGPGHVQVYLGDGKVLEAPQSGDKVKISEMTPSVIKRM
jgi:cell wall-associated NlpC family hydrolase